MNKTGFLFYLWWRMKSLGWEHFKDGPQQREAGQWDAQEWLLGTQNSTRAHPSSGLGSASACPVWPLLTAVKALQRPVPPSALPPLCPASVQPLQLAFTSALKVARDFLHPTHPTRTSVGLKLLTSCDTESPPSSRKHLVHLAPFWEHVPDCPLGSRAVSLLAHPRP